jgi:hypothetical protein
MRKKVEVRVDALLPLRESQAQLHTLCLILMHPAERPSTTDPATTLRDAATTPASCAHGPAATKARREPPPSIDEDPLRAGAVLNDYGPALQHVICLPTKPAGESPISMPPHPAAAGVPPILNNSNRSPTPWVPPPPDARGEWWSVAETSKDDWNETPPSPRGGQGGGILPPVPGFIDLTGDDAISVYEEVVVIGTPPARKATLRVTPCRRWTTC